MTTPDEDVAEAEAAARRALGVCLASGCGAHQRFDTHDGASAWCAEHIGAHPDHRVDVWPADIDDLAVVNPMMRAIYASLIDDKRRAEAERDAILNDPDWGKTWVSPAFYEAVRERAEGDDASPEMLAILGSIRPMTPMEAPHDDRQDPRTQPRPRPRARRRRGTPRRWR
jgi:hypothetical protein